MSRDGRLLFVSAKATKNLTESDSAYQWTHEIAKLTGMEVFGHLIGKFDPPWGSGPGYTVLTGISTSCVEIHTFPETNSVWLMFLSCANFNPDVVIESFSTFFGVTEIRESINQALVSPVGHDASLVRS